MIDIKRTLTIAGSDSSGGAGIQADLKTFSEYGTYGLSALTAIATMDPDNNWSHGVTTIDIPVIEAQLKTIFASDHKIAAMKTGMLPSVEIINVVAKAIKDNHLENIVIDPVMICKGDDEVLNPENANALRDVLTPLATVVTPNLFEAGKLSGLGILTTLEDMKKAAVKIHGLGAKNVVIKGGKALAGDKAIDLFYDGSTFTVLESEKMIPAYNHGAGCTFAAAITAGLAQGLSVEESILKAKDFVTEAIRNGFQYNQYIGSVFHSGYRLSKQETI
ncbi:bifunctional hydroxymethylpyrimidine kinase/phosphomethylpyrimidine kinase [Carnobacterium funditum]|uniref:bifunctional hydroxymethylpyrimidine kinase/phosphomethylpyrimidine kinase n=1 Tax=Carnobacterium funditum TaxID=2752 RepID=UPI0009FE7B5B|nr:bifunctional hydroxymethylpyrimidine kinase/phosphomethylpyrimidine kinase [Carnobacterium funditum]